MAMRFDPVLRAGRVEDAPACARILQDWLDATAWMPDLHDLAETEGWMQTSLFPACDVTVAESHGVICGYLALEAGEIASITVAADARGAGIGTRLLDHAKAARPGGLTLWTFQANTGAQAFYARNGFTERRRTAGENAEGLPDVMMAWAGDA